MTYCVRGDHRVLVCGDRHGPIVSSVAPVSSSIHNVIVLPVEQRGEMAALSGYPVHYVRSLKVHFLISTVYVENPISTGGSQQCRVVIVIMGPSQANSLFKTAPQ